MLQSGIFTFVLVAAALFSTSAVAEVPVAVPQAGEQPLRVKEPTRAAQAENSALEGQSAEQIFSGPQVGEKLPPLPVRSVFDEEVGKELDFVAAAAGKPIVLIFIHELNRPSIGMARALGNYAQSRAKDGLATGIIWLDDDATEAEITLKRIRHALPQDVPVGISTDGKEGPGSYGLNRHVALTILVGKDGAVTDNFALVQPSLQADLPKIVGSIVHLVGGEVPPLAELIGRPAMMRGNQAGNADSEIRDLLRPMIRRDATAEAVDQAAAAVESFLKDNEAAQAEVGRISKTIVDSGKLTNYGTPRAQEHLRKWAVKYGNRERDDAERSTNDTADNATSEGPSR